MLHSGWYAPINSEDLSLSDSAGSGALGADSRYYLYMETMRLLIQSKNTILNDS